MFKRRLFPYIIGGGIVAFLAVSYVTYRVYQSYVGFQAFISNAQAFNRSTENQHDHFAHDHTHRGGELQVTSRPNQVGEVGRTEPGHEHEHHLAPSGEHVYEISSVPLYSHTPLSQEQIELREWIQTGKMTPTVEEQFAIREQLLTYVEQSVVTPDGKLHKVIVPQETQYEEGDAILQSELGPPMLLEEAQNPKRGDGKLIIDGADYYLPEEFHSISDPYAREEYLNKFAWSIENGVSMDEVQEKIARRELDFSLSKDAKRHVDEHEAMMERYKMLAPVAPPLSDKSPVKVSFLPDEGEDALPGWMRKLDGNHPSRSSEAVEGEDYSVTDIVSERGINKDANGAPVRANISLSPLDLPGMAEPKPSRRSGPGIEVSQTPNPLSAESIERRLKERLSPDRFDRTQQLIDQYGSGEALRHLRQMDPDAARQFERERQQPPVRSQSGEDPSTR